MTQWATHPDYPNYRVSDSGEIVNTTRSKLPKLHDNRYDGYRVCLFREGVGKFFQLSRLVAELFLEEWDPRFVVGFKDGNKKNVHVSNLYMTERIAS